MKSNICFVLLLLLTGCGLRTEMVRVNAPDVRVNPDLGPTVAITAVRDNRSTELLSKIPAATRAANVGGLVRGSNGVNVSLESGTASEKTKELIIQALRSMGYRTTDSCEQPCTQLEASLSDFSVKMPFNLLRAASWTQQMVADISVDVTARTPDKTHTFTVKGHGTNIFQVASRENWEIALERAVKDFSDNFKQKMSQQDTSTMNAGSAQTSP